MNVNHLHFNLHQIITATNRRWDLVGDPSRVLFTRRLDHMLIGGWKFLSPAANGAVADLELP